MYTSIALVYIYIYIYIHITLIQEIVYADICV